MTHAHKNIHAFFLDGPAGRLEALLNEGREDAAHAAVVCHPHPLYGGTMHNKVVFHAMKALHSLGLPVLRFNFRGTGRSQGEHDNGRGEAGDVRAAVDWLDNEFSLPIVFCGFSFGAAVGLRAACPDARVQVLISLGTPIAAEGRIYSYDFLAQCSKPKLFLSGGQDPFGPRAELETAVAAAAEPKQFVLIEGAGHFFEGKLDEMRGQITAWVRERLQSDPVRTKD